MDFISWIHHINKLEGKNYIALSVNVDSAFDKNSALFHDSKITDK